jgi:alkylation response protein AidB-like acyl-CoA dehydrogenase
LEFRYTDEQLALRDTLQRFITNEYDFEHRRGIARTPFGLSREAWARYADLGILALPLPEEDGGLGGNSVDLMPVMEWVGRGLLLEPYLSTVVLTGQLIANLGTRTQRNTLLAGIGSGQLFVALAHYEPHSRYTLEHVSTSAQLERDGYLLSGFKNVVLDAPSADQILISARTSGSADDATGISLFIVPRAAGGVKLRAYPTQDGRRAADIALDRVKVGLDACLGSPSVALPFLERAIDKANAALCAEAVGIMDALNEHTLEHLKARKQFGVPIGSFQALQHRMVDMVTAAEQARSMAILAAVRADSNDPAERSRAVSGAKAYVMQAARFVGQQAIQLHGGMGVVDELIVSHYFKRLTVIGLTYGDADHHLARFGSSLFAA